MCTTLHIKIFRKLLFYIFEVKVEEETANMYKQLPQNQIKNTCLYQEKESLAIDLHSLKSL